MAIIISNETIAPTVYGANEVPEVQKANIQFGKGSIAKVLEKVGKTDDPNVYFGYDSTNKAGIVVADGKLMSSKVLDVVATEEVAATYYTEGDEIPEGKNVGDVKTQLVPASITITYVENKEIKTATINVPGADLEKRVKAIEDLVYADENNTIDKLQEVLTWFAEVSDTKESYTVKLGEGEDAPTVELGKGQLGLLTSVAQNKKDIEDLKAVIDDLDVEETEVGDGNVTVTYSETDGKVEISSVDVAETSGTFTAATEATDDDEAKPANLSVAEADAAKLLNAGAIANIKAYVDAVAEANQEGVTIAEGSEDYLEVDADDDHKIGVKTTALGDAVGLTKVVDEKTGAVTWTNASGEIVPTGLATAADVAAEIVADEEVIAAALNEHELAIKNLASKAITVTSSKNNIVDLSTGGTTETGEFTVVDGKITKNDYVPALDNIPFDGTDATTTYTIKNGDTAVEETIVSVNASVITKLLSIIQSERVRANNAEAALKQQLNEHENRLTWIELGD